MKYMGSKRAMLSNGLGDLLGQAAPSAGRFIDLFTGSAAVATHVASRFAIPVEAYDLQEFSIVLANSVLQRDRKLDWNGLWENWYGKARSKQKLIRTPSVEKLTQKKVAAARAWCATQSGPITRAYGGHYFSPVQAVWIDCLRASLPETEPERTVALAALVDAASQSAASPGHTAQPFQPTRTAKKFLDEAWQRNITKRTKTALKDISARRSLAIGSAIKCDANEAAKRVRNNDLVFVDPPYSGVHYSRFYHVLESIALGDCGEVTGTGRYPDRKHRPRSDYSMKKSSKKALEELLRTLSARGANVILTFPDHDCSNGLSGGIVRSVGSKYFEIVEQAVKTQFSTLGGPKEKPGSKKGRGARKTTNELMLYLTPR